MRRSPIERDEKRDEKRPRWTSMKGRPQGWDMLTGDEEEEHPNRQHIDPALIPEGMSLQWVTSEVFGQPFPEHRMKFERKGWTPVDQVHDFDGQFNGMFMPRDMSGEIKLGGQVLMARPMHLSDKAKKRDKFEANRQVADKTQGLINGDMPGITMDPTHRSARQFNHINRSYEPIMLPDE